MSLRAQCVRPWDGIVAEAASGRKPGAVLMLPKPPVSVSHTLDIASLTESVLEQPFHHPQHVFAVDLLSKTMSMNATSRGSVSWGSTLSYTLPGVDLCVVRI